MCVGPELARDANPGQTDDEENLSEHQVRQAEFFLEDGAASFDALFGISQLGCCVDVLAIAHLVSRSACRGLLRCIQFVGAHP